MPAIVIEQLVKRYGDNVAVDGLDLVVEQGEVFALLGPNGAGKTTTVEILEGHRTRTSGHVSVLGFDPETGGRAFRERIGVVLQEAGVDDEFSVAELCALYRGMYPRRRAVDDVIALAGLTEKRDARVSTLSGGQRRRLDLALGLVGDPDLIFLDEPTTGFDPSARRNAWRVIQDLRGLGKTILLTTHYMEEAQQLADRVGVIVRGRLAAVDRPDALVAASSLSSVIRFSLHAEPSEPLPRLRGSLHRTGPAVEVATEDPVADLHALTSWATGADAPLLGLTVQRPTLDDVYVELTRSAEAADAAAGR